MIQKFIENIEKTISSAPIILSSDIQKHFGPDDHTAYIKGTFLFVNSSILEIAIFANEHRNTVNIDKYRFHYMDKHRHMVFRYDNAPHHPEISNFPHHKHLPHIVVSSDAPALKDLIDEISAIIIKG